MARPSRSGTWGRGGTSARSVRVAEATSRSSVAVDADGTRLATQPLFTRAVDLWNAYGGDAEGTRSTGRCRTWGSDGRLFVSSYDGTMAIVDEHGEPLSTIFEPDGYLIEDVDLSPDGRLIAAAINHGRNPLLARVSLGTRARALER